jgi:bifunctional non-homologous end joining protein LigD
MIVFDLDPGPPATIVQCAQVAFWLRAIFEHFGLHSFPKNSGSKGLQIYVPLHTPTSYEETKPFAHAMARLLEEEHPELVVSDMKKALRTGKVLVDWSQNDEHKTTVSVYSLRARERQTVSTPLRWEEVEKIHKKKDPNLFKFEAAEILERVEKLGDLFEPVLKLKQKLPKLSDLLSSGALKENERESIANAAERRAQEMAKKTERRGPPPATSGAASSASRKSAGGSRRSATARAPRKSVR